jgi:hypothetical protein
MTFTSCVLSRKLVELVGIEPTPSLEMMEVIDFLQKRTLPRMPGMPRNPESPNSLYVYCTAISSKINLFSVREDRPLYAANGRKRWTCRSQCGDYTLSVINRSLRTAVESIIALSANSHSRSMRKHPVHEPTSSCQVQLLRS